MKNTRGIICFARYTGELINILASLVVVSHITTKISKILHFLLSSCYYFKLAEYLNAIFGLFCLDNF